MWHGWTDTTLEPRSSLNYYNSVVAVTGGGLRLSDRSTATIPDRDDARSTTTIDKHRGHGSRRDSPRENLEDTQDFFRLFTRAGREPLRRRDPVQIRASPTRSRNDVGRARRRPRHPRGAGSMGRARRRAQPAHRRRTSPPASPTRRDRSARIRKIARYKGKGDPNQPGVLDVHRRPRTLRERLRTTSFGTSGRTSRPAISTTVAERRVREKAKH